MPRRAASKPLLSLPPLLLLLGAALGAEAYFADWGVIGGRPQEPTCVDIPANMPLCSGIDYNKMRLPNLLEHDTLKEAQQQAGYWVPLLNLQCHPDTQLFLCSLFTPVCLESPIYPCRSLCEAVRSGCESRMQTYSFPWPDMLRCDKFPLDNDMCITVQHATTPGREIVQAGECEACEPVETYENILDNFCRADVVVKTRVSRQRRGQLVCKRARAYKSGDGEDERRALRRPRFSLTQEASCCNLQASRTRYLIMARWHGQDLVPTFVMPFKKSKPLRKALKKFPSLNCSDPKLITGGPEVPTLSQEPPQRARPRRPKNGRKRPKGRKDRKKGQDADGPAEQDHMDHMDHMDPMEHSISDANPLGPLSPISPSDSVSPLSPSDPVSPLGPLSPSEPHTPPATPPPPSTIDGESLQFLHEDAAEDAAPSVLPPKGRAGRKRKQGRRNKGEGKGEGKGKGQGRKRNRQENQTELPDPQP